MDNSQEQAKTIAISRIAGLAIASAFFSLGAAKAVANDAGNGAPVSPAPVVVEAPGPVYRQTVGPLQFEYTNYANGLDGAQDKKWRAFFSGDLETSMHAPSFSAHFAVNRSKDGKPAGSQAFAILWTPRLCQDIETIGKATLSACTAVLERFFPDRREPERVEVTNTACVVRFGANPPAPDDAGWNAAQVTYRKSGDQWFAVLSAVFNGELKTACTQTIDLGRVE